MIINLKFEFSSIEQRDEAFSIIYNLWETLKKKLEYQKNQMKSELSPPSVPFPVLTNSLLSTEMKNLESNTLKKSHKKTKSKLDFVCDLPNEEDWNLLLKRAKNLTVTKNTTIIQEGEINTKLYQIVKGTVRVEKTFISLDYPIFNKLDDSKIKGYLFIKKKKTNIFFEEQLKNFFNTFDLNKDNYIDSNEVINLIFFY